MTFLILVVVVMNFVDKSIKLSNLKRQTRNVRSSITVKGSPLPDGAAFAVSFETTYSS